MFIYLLYIVLKSKIDKCMKIVKNKHFLKILFHFSKKKKKINKSMNMQSWLSFNTIITLSKILKKNKHVYV